MNFVKAERFSLRSHPELDEKWVQDRIAEDPSILGLGDLILKDKERIQPRAGRLDILLQDAELPQRYEVEIQLGKTDEAHIIRTIEYWDIERKRYPQYDHTAVLIAEDITSRFLNVISLFNSSIPLIAIQMNAVRIRDDVALVFTTVMNVLSRGFVDEDEETHQVTDRAYWESKGTKATLGMADDLLTIVKTLDPALDFKYNKFYIGLARDGRPNNFATFRPRKSSLNLELQLEQSEEVTSKLEQAGIDTLPYDPRWGNYRLRLTKADIRNHSDLLKDLLTQAFGRSSGGA